MHPFPAISTKNISLHEGSNDEVSIDIQIQMGLMLHNRIFYIWKKLKCSFIRAYEEGLKQYPD